MIPVHKSSVIMELLRLLFVSAKYVSLIVIPALILLFSYRLTFHPLRKYPGPFLASLSDAYAGYYAASMSLHVRTRVDQQKYGIVMRHGPNRLVFSSSRALRDIYQNERVSKSHLYRHTAVTPGVYTLFNVIDKDVHRLKRKLIGQATSERSMRVFETTMAEQIDTFLRILISSSGSPVNMTERLKRLSMDIVGLLGFGYPLNTQTDPTNRFLISAHVFGNFRSNLFMQFPFAKATGIYSFLERLATNEVQRYFSTMERIIASRVAEDKHARHDLYSIVADQMSPNGEYMKDSEIWEEAVFFFPAGADTTATCLSAAFFYLARNPTAYKKVAEEIRTAFGAGRDIRAGPTLASCQYLRACIDETLRMSPPGSGTPWRELSKADTSKEPFIVDGHVIPPGVQVGVNMYAHHHNEEYFPEPFAFKPERWLESDTSATQRKRMRDVFVPFSLGTRNCPGKAMAYQEASLVLAKTFWYFDFELAPGDLGKLGAGNRKLGTGREREDEFQLYDIVTSTHDGPNLTFMPRGNLHEELYTKD
ncbi:cytochrome P450 [Hypoxylon sp. EC38]|nr:cytochrome P450 [Hypoxylon sp. EC38]